MIPASVMKFQSLERLQIVIKKQVLRLSDLVKVNQPRLEFGFSFPVEKCRLSPAFLPPNACLDC